MKVILNILEKIIPKKDKILFHSFPDYADNSYALFKYIVENKIEKNEIVWLYDKKNIHEKILYEFGKKIKCYKKNSLIGIWSFFRSKKVFCTHGLFSCVETKNKKINLWHGMPLKNIGFMDSEAKEIATCDYLISTSEMFKNVMSKSFKLKENKVFLTGQPRNDLLFEETKFYKKMAIDKKKYNRIIMYLPTYRKSIIGDLRIDGKYNEEKLGIIKIIELYELNENLKKNNNFMIIKLHPMDILEQKIFNSYSNILIIKSEELEKINEQLYPLLGSVDLLMTDYSSVWIDYEILKKPIYFVIEDYKEYEINRGFTIKNLQNLLPGDIIQNFKILLEKLDNIPSEIQKETNDVFNKYKDNKSCERLLKSLEDIIEN